MSLTAFHDRSTRISCIIPQCPRSALRSLFPNADEIICGRCWRTVDLSLRERYAQLKKREKRLERLEQLKALQHRHFGVSWSLLREQQRKNWATIEADAYAKAALGLEGTAGAPRGKRT